VLWTAPGSNMRLNNWGGLQFGKLPATDHIAWAQMGCHIARVGGIKCIPFERNLRQYEALGATTVRQKFPHDRNVTNNAQLTATSGSPTVGAGCDFGSASDFDCYESYYARRENNGNNVVGFALEDAFWATTLTHDAVFKISYIDSGSAVVNLRNAAGNVLGSFTTGTSGNVRTATFFVDDFTATGSGSGKDFELHTPGTAVDFTFVQVIKDGGSYAKW
jgi:hypothetical protein